MQFTVISSRAITVFGFFSETVSQAGFRVPACMTGVSRGAFTCDGWQVTLCDPIWQATSRSSEMGFP